MISISQTQFQKLGDGTDSLGDTFLKDADPWTQAAHLARRHYENFHVGSVVFPKRLRRPLWVIYAYCRTVDDLGDEATGDRLALLEQFEQELNACFGGFPTLPMMQALKQTIDDFNLPAEPFFRLIEANKRDQLIHRYPYFDDLVDYCSFSANPVGRLVLALTGQSSATNDKLSDAICTALQLTNFWQDVAVDWEKGRVYIPLTDMKRFGYTVDMLAAKTVNDPWHRLMRHQIQRTRSFFAEGQNLLDRLPGRLRVEIALITLGGRKILELIETTGYDVFQGGPRLTKRQKMTLLWRSLWLYAPRRRLT